MRQFFAFFRIKRLDTFILGKFLQLFVGAFFICLFVFVMQFLWRYVDDLVGKGLTLDVLGQFFWHVSVYLVPTSLPLAVLLASLITFGNMGENLELLSMKAAGVPLVRVMRPILLLIIPLSAFVFYFQNEISTNAQKQLRALLVSIKIAQPAVEIPEGVFYNMRDFNLYVVKKNAQTGMLYNTIIYKMDQGFDRAQIVLADSAKIEMTADKMHMKLTLWSGEQFQNLKTEDVNVFKSESVPYDRETFMYKQLLIDFDANFNQIEANELAFLPQAKNWTALANFIDSMNLQIDSAALASSSDYAGRALPTTKAFTRKDSLATLRALSHVKLNFDSLVAKIPKEKMERARNRTASTLQSFSTEMTWRNEAVEDQEYFVRKHEVEWHQRITLALACLLFFFVGAPLGAIIRKGGLGMPTIISVGIFILYYIINTSGMKMARDGSINMVVGMWMSTFILTPAGAYLTFMANRDSVVFNLDAYIAFLRRLLGFRTKRHLFRKEVIITPPDVTADLQLAQSIRQEAEDYRQTKRLWLAPNYFRLFFRTRPDQRMEQLSDRIEELVEDLANTRDMHVLDTLNRVPFIYAHAHTTPFSRQWINYVFGVLFPLGLIIWVRAWRFRLRLARDLRQTIKCMTTLEEQLDIRD
ncbi:LptF/LptG family permease [Ihuprevotella massiliensis]|uniref:LptF/LptG family permease n=2 Tax=Ihuprevotella massiliensis TaxID=1852368 RepID=UPI00094F219F